MVDQIFFGQPFDFFWSTKMFLVDQLVIQNNLVDQLVDQGKKHLVELKDELVDGVFLQVQGWIRGWCL